MVGLLHADPHPGNFKIMADGRLGVVDFGLVARMPDGLPAAVGRILRIAQRAMRTRSPTVCTTRASLPPTSMRRTCWTTSRRSSSRPPSRGVPVQPGLDAGAVRPGA